MDIKKRYPIQIGDPRQVNVTLVGCGGTGSFLALHLARLAYHARERHGMDLCLLFVDPDVVELQNLGRQNFCPAELGQPKAQALATRYSAAFGLGITYHAEPFERGRLRDFPRAHRDACLVIGAVDGAEGRQAIHEAVRIWNGGLWWLDCGNHEHAGQVLIGNKTDLWTPTLSPLGFCTALPAPSMQHPELLEAPAPVATPDPSCADLALTDVQSLMINQAVAGWAASYVSRLVLSRDLDTYATYFDLAAGSARSELITDDGNISREMEE